MLATSSAAAQSFPVGATGELAARLLASHNRERAAVGAPPLEWDQRLADHAASYGPVLARLHHLVHSPRDDRPGERENLAMAWHATLSPEELVGLWSKERLLLESGSYIFPGEKPHRQLGGHCPLYADGMANDDEGRLRHLFGRLGLSRLPLFAARQQGREADLRRCGRARRRPLRKIDRTGQAAPALSRETTHADCFEGSSGPSPQAPQSTCRRCCSAVRLTRGSSCLRGSPSSMVGRAAA